MELLTEDLQQIAEGAWYYPVSDAAPYDQAYFNKYVGYAATPMGGALTLARMRLVRKHFRMNAALVDVGIGCGDFVDRMGCWGYDINPAGVKWLHERNRYWDIYNRKTAVATFWDSLEHIADIQRVLRLISHYIFVSIPIFKDLDHVHSSKHFRTDEHYWYFTQAGFVSFLNTQGWSVIDCNDVETKLGREDIMSFAFKRRDA